MKFTIIISTNFALYERNEDNADKNKELANWDFVISSYSNWFVFSAINRRTIGTLVCSNRYCMGFELDGVLIGVINLYQIVLIVQECQLWFWF